MNEHPEYWLDADIKSLQLEYEEKSGLQIYRNYNMAFEKHAICKFVKLLDAEHFELSNFGEIISSIVDEDGRFLPVIACAYADDILEEMYKRTLSDGVPGGKGNMLRGFGPLSSLANRIQLAHAFDVLSADLMTDLDRLRVVRNTISHSWKIGGLGELLESSKLADLEPIENYLAERDELASALSNSPSSLAIFRARLVWILGRLVYEAAAYDRAKKVRLDPARALYGKPVPKWLVEISTICLQASVKIFR